ncbi:hypothetical protein BFJ63_vAg16403 [Fusarium oxysporum f. sp. narcissi]|uniref:Uncharacterized protein n=1 Tax=Fusarium oxysporum f. sp. narcissi TaxID=451672 RepID=A0A4V1RY83_FUSOX|nr:hypothetical protein BFJ63_vAg16403 [Fusarium oxysporum f. sp. narcissi]
MHDDPARPNQVQQQSFLQGAFKFGGYEYFKARAVDYLGHSTATDNRNAVYLASAAAAKFLGDIALK